MRSYSICTLLSGVAALALSGCGGAMNATSPNPVPNPPPTTAPHSSRFLYAVNSIERTVSGYSINAASGALSPLDVPMATGDAPIYAAAMQDGKFLYVANGGTSDVSAYRINQTSGVLAPTAPAGTFPEGIAVDATGKFAYVANWISNDVTSYTITPGTGGLVPASRTSVGAGCAPQELTLDPSSTHLFVSCPGLSAIVEFSIDAATGALMLMTPVFSTGPAPGPRGVAVDASGAFLYSAWNSTSRAGAAAIHSDGSLTAVAGTAATGNRPIGVVMSGTQ